MELPDWANKEKWKKTQESVHDDIIDSFERGSSIVMLDAPTGAGKTLIGEMVRQTLKTRGLYLCSTLDLQSQFSSDFPTAAILRGRTNYPTFDDPASFPSLNAGDCVKRKIVIGASTKMECQWCNPVHACPYESAKAHALRSELVCSNLTYFLHESNFVGNLTLNRGLVVIDEADLIEDALLNFVAVSISQRQQKEYGISPPEKKTVEDAWIDWADNCQPVLEALLKRPSGHELRDIRKRKSLERLLADVKRLNHPDSGIASGNWIYTGYDRGSIEFKPVRVDTIAKDFLWRHAKRFLLMSATTISFGAVAENLGIS